MAVHDFRCPNCNGSFRLSDMQLGKRLRCGKCNEIFTAPNAGELESLVTIEPLAPPIVAKPLTTPSEEPAPYLTIEDAPSAIAEKPKDDVPPPIPAVVETPQAERDIPLRRRRRSAANQDSDEPKRKVRRARDDEEDDDERESRPVAKVGMAALVLGGIALAFIVGISVIGYVIYAGFQQVPTSNPVAIAPFPPAPFAVAIPNVDPNPFNPGLNPAMPQEKPFVFVPAKVAAIRPAQLADDAGEIKLTSPATEVAAGGGGRFLIFLQPSDLQLAIFDAQEAKIVKQFPLADANALVAANATHAVVVYPGAKRMERYDLMALKKEHDGPFVTTDTVNSIAMGSASAGPLLAVLDSPKVKDAIQFFDPMTAERYTITTNGIMGIPFRSRGRAAANGRMFVLSRLGFGGEIISLAEEPATITKINRDLYPAPDARQLYGYEGAVAFPGNRIEGKRDILARDQWWPALHGPLAFRATFRRVPGNVFDSVSQLTIYNDGQALPLPMLPKLPLESGLNTAKPKQLDYADHLFLIPDAKLFVALDEKRTTLYLRRFDLATVPPLGKK